MKDETSIFGAKPERLDRLVFEALQDSEAEEEAGPTAPLPAVLERPGGQIGRYKLLHALGEGGMGIVYLAEQKHPIRRQVALKVIKPGMDSKRVIARFEAERQALALLDHPHIAHVYDAGTTESGRPYFVMEFVEGLPITEHCDHHELTIEDRLDLFTHVCQAVHHAHQKGIIHRDIKPSNILVSIRDDQAIPKIIDFGVAKATSEPLTERTLFTEQGQFFGTPEYMSPEQADISTEDIDTRSDIYSLGVLLYVLLAGVLPFDAKDLREGGVEHIRRIIREVNPKTPSTRLTSLGEKAENVAQSRRTEVVALAKRLHRELEWIPLKAMRKERARRYGSASELADDIENYLRGDPLIAGPESTTYRAVKMFRKHRVPFAAGVIAVASLVVGLVIAASMYLHAEDARADAQAVSDYLQWGITTSLNLRHVKSKEITVRSVLDTMSDGLGAEFRNQPLFEASMRQQFAAAYGVLGLYAKAELNAERAFEICRTQLGPENMTTVYSWFQVGWVHLLQSRYSEAEPLLTKALARFQLALEEDHYNRLWCMAFLGWVYNFQGRFPEAEELFKAGLDAAQRTQGAGRSVAPFLMYSWAFAYQIQGRYQEAERLYVRGLEICGEWHDEALFLKRGLGVLLWEMGRYDEAEEFLQAAVKGRREVWGEEHHETPRALADLGWLYNSKGRYEEAEALFDKALEAARQAVGDAHTTTTHCMHGLGTLYLSQGRHYEAKLLLEEVLEIESKQFGEENWHVLRVENTLANLYVAQSRSDRAESLFKKVLAGRLSKLGEEHPEVLETKNDLAMLYRQQAHYEAAEPLLVEAVKGRRLKLGDEHPHTLESLNNLLELYEAWDKPEEAGKWRAELPQTKAAER